MPDKDSRIDPEASRAVKRIETQMRMEGRLDKADGAEGAAILLLPLFLGSAALVAGGLDFIGVKGVAKIILGVPLLIGLCVLGLYLVSRRR